MCDEDSARFVRPGSLTCDTCNYTCKKCSGANRNQCTSCFYSESVTSGSYSSLSCTLFKILNKKDKNENFDSDVDDLDF